MRTTHSIRNITIMLVSQIILALLGFFSRKVFLDTLGIEYLGLSSLLTNVLAMLALAESGIGMSIIYQLYKPLAVGNHRKVIALIQLYKRAYLLLAVLVLLLSLSLLPFLPMLMNDTEPIPYLTVIFLLFVARNMVSYLNAHKWSLIQADQRGYVLLRIDLIFQMITTFIKVFILIWTANFILYLVVELIMLIIQQLVNGSIVRKRYPYIHTKKKYSLDSETKTSLIRNVKALLLHNIGGFLIFGTDHILISSFISVATVGLYSIYTLILQQVTGLANNIIHSVSASIGNLIATEDSEKNYAIFKTIFLIIFFIYSISVVLLFNVIEPFISWWVGAEYLLETTVLIVILLNFYLTGMKAAIAIFKKTAGLFVQDQYAPIIEGGINLIISLILVQYIGLMGVFIGTTFATLLTVFWTQPVIVYKHVFKRSVFSYFISYSRFGLLTIFMCSLTNFVCQFFIEGYDLMSLISRALICLTLSVLIYGLVFLRTPEMVMLIQLVKKIRGGKALFIQSNSM
ncbi:lipopolysaccharide biosynthesis protein [Alkalihalobacillus hemicellulosilyticus]|uniref:Probable flippase n=1 Tax=Halalkalibacter hemicellulosilyticusJCM 9152 TaxID=1236971 RepID=W4QFC6_9BACI|nr:oligosaccharide flippase family protein [Halalkalibacter hemicellulosilyticus]GAE30034.1 probable flippase [Halalkalibacter hemicellulosilyticusJCM 9152]